ncbi:MAG: FAD-dependent oxidoreductase, partial [Kordiimonadaceae bacterium]|nr:FAD-dependent oxidoreductase [Kordiimonadaceae bacterium]
MKNKITRRDFLNGTQVAIGASLLSPWTKAFGSSGSEFELGSNYYPPALSGMRGSHDGSWETMHERVTGTTWGSTEREEDYDLVIVGAGISGLTAAYYYNKEHPDARILLLDNHDDFGGHAKRNEFEINGETRIGYGGTESIDTPSNYADIGKELLIEIGIDVDKFYQAYDQKLYSSMGLSKGIVFDKETFGEQKLVTGYNKIPWEEFAANSPMNEQAKSDLVRICTEEKDYLPGLTYDEKWKILDNISYDDFLLNYAKVDQQVVELYRRWGMSK